jgi:hypothetical protein
VGEREAFQAFAEQRLRPVTGGLGLATEPSIAIQETIGVFDPGALVRA